MSVNGVEMVFSKEKMIERLTNEGNLFTSLKSV